MQIKLLEIRKGVANIFQYFFIQPNMFLYTILGKRDWRESCGKHRQLSRSDNIHREVNA
jgi:hypothetical protein